MIGEVSHGSNIWGLVHYLVNDESRVAWTHAQGQFLETAQNRGAWRANASMIASTARGSKADDYVYHLMLALPPDETLTKGQWLETSNRILSALGLEKHQVLMVQHNDTSHQHLHLAINRVHPETRRAARLRHDYRKIETECRRIERDLGLRPTPGRHGRLPGQELSAPGRAPSPGDWRRRDKVLELREIVRPHIEHSQSWAELMDGLATHGLTLQPRGGGFVLTDGVRFLSASKVVRDASRGRLEKRFGKFHKWRVEIDSLSWAVESRRKRAREWQRTADRLENARALVRGDLGPARPEDLRAAREDLRRLPHVLRKLRPPPSELRRLRRNLQRLGGRHLVYWARSQASSLLLPREIALPLSLARGSLSSLLLPPGVSTALRLAKGATDVVRALSDSGRSR